MMDGFYRAFEDKHRGSREVIKERQEIYLPLVRPLVRLYSQPSALDLGCGRGEWLEILTDAGFIAHGIDLDDGMLAECRARGMHVRTQDALSALQDLPDDSQAVISGFHFAEHIPFDVLQKIVQEALRVLKPAGLLILETPNPENILVGSSNFYLDPSHNRPIPPLLMEFLPEYYGFHRVKILRLQEPIRPHEKRSISIHDVLGGVSPDYAVVAQKEAPPDILRQVSGAFDREYGTTLAMLAGRYETDRNDALSSLDSNLNSNLEHRAKSLDHELNVLVQRVDSALDQRIVLLNQQLQQVHQHLQRVDQHLHRIEARRPISLLKRVIKKIVKPVARRVKSYLENNHAQHERLVRIARAVGLYRLLSWTLNKAVPPPPPLAEPVVTPESKAAELRAETLAIEQALVEQPAAVRQVFHEIDSAMKKSERS
jgi:SAM-dependent methyltransferase